MFFNFSFHPITAAQVFEPYESFSVDDILAWDAGNAVTFTDFPIFIQNNG